MEINRVMLVDDDPDIRRIAQLTLNRVAGWEVLPACSGFEAMEMLSAQKPDIILLDVMMPGMDGLKTLAKIRERPELSHIPIVFMTAKVLRHEVDGYLALGAAGTITKPFNPITLPSEVRLIVSHWGAGRTSISDGDATDAGGVKAVA
jgi:CheY-like chemotaxis protein